MKASINILKAFIALNVLTMGCSAHALVASSVAQLEVSEKKSFHTTWFKPVALEKKEGQVKIRLTGVTQKKARIIYAEDDFGVIENDSVVPQENEDPSEQIKETEFIADATGLFSVELWLPEKKVILPIKIVPESSDFEPQNYQVNLNIKGADILLTSNKYYESGPEERTRFDLWFGMGYNYLSYEQTSPSVHKGLSFNSLSGPSYFFKLGIWLTNVSNLELSIKSSPGETQATSAIDLVTARYSWDVYELEFTQFPENWKTYFYDQIYSQLGYGAGIQYHIVPFVTRTGADFNDFEVTENNIAMVSLGGYNKIFFTADWELELYLIYQHPVLVGSVFNLTPKYAMEGSIGGIYHGLKTLQMGLFWYGQWQTYAFNNEDKYLKNQVSGEQTLFFSNLELRMGYEF